jgi:uncharacterized protein YjdB
MRLAASIVANLKTGGFSMKRNTLLLGVLALALTFSFVLVACDNPAGEDTKPATGVTIDEGTAVTVDLGDSVTLHATVTPADSTDTITWLSEDTATATINPKTGEVRGVARGTATITATAGDKTVAITVTVRAPLPATGVTIDEGDAATVAVGGTVTLHATITPADSTDTITWSSNDATKAAVNATTGAVSGVAEGEVVITATAGDKTDAITVTIRAPLPATGVTIDEGDAATVAVGASIILHGTVTPADSTDTITWSSSDAAKAAVNATTGAVSGIAAGTAVVTATAGGATDTITVTVATPKPAAKVTIDGGAQTIEINATVALHAKVIPVDSTDPVVWSSSDTTKAAINATTGVVTGVAAGTAVITAMAGGRTTTITITVTSPATGVTITESDQTIAVKATVTLHATVTPADSTDTVIWSSSDTTKATVNSTTGAVTGVAAGTAVITATAGSKTASIIITVTKPATWISISERNQTIEPGDIVTLHATVTPADSTDTVVWSSDDTGKATVDPTGVVTGVAAGTAVITATAGSRTASITVTVVVPATGITITQPAKAIIVIGETLELDAMVTPENSTDTVHWSSSNDYTATVDRASGVVTGVAMGTPVITARAGGKTDQINITVKHPLPIRNWTDSIFTPSSTINDIAWGGAPGNEKFVAVGDKGRMAYSSDGMTWTEVSNSTFNDAYNIDSIAWGGAPGNEKFVAVRDKGMAYSSDGVSWTAVSSGPFDYTDSIVGITWGGTAGNEKFVAVANGRKEFLGEHSWHDGYYGKMAYSPDGVDWTVVSDSTFDSNLGEYRIHGIAWGGTAGAEKFVAGGSGGKMVYSSDGMSWAAHSDSALDYITDITWGGAAGDGKFVACVGGNGGKMAYSSDGMTWTVVSDSPFAGSVDSITDITWGGAVGNEKFVAVGNVGKIAYSSDGESWTAVRIDTFSTIDSIDCIAYGGPAGNKRFVAGGTGGNGVKIAYSDVE